jgi:hypothetical protein
MGRRLLLRCLGEWSCVSEGLRPWGFNSRTHVASIDGGRAAKLVREFGPECPKGRASLGGTALGGYLNRVDAAGGHFHSGPATRLHRRTRGQ